jgi:hypothetical protein
LDAAIVVEGYAALTMTVANWPEVVITANCALPLVEQPATNRVAIRTEIPSTRDTPPRLNRKLLNIAAILFGLTWLQEKRIETKLSPGPHIRSFLSQ